MAEGGIRPLPAARRRLAAVSRVHIACSRTGPSQRPECRFRVKSFASTKLPISVETPKLISIIIYEKPPKFGKL